MSVSSLCRYLGAQVPADGWFTGMAQFKIKFFKGSEVDFLANLRVKLNENVTTPGVASEHKWWNPILR
jgi:hypothetical protein